MPRQGPRTGLLRRPGRLLEQLGLEDRLHERHTRSRCADGGCLSDRSCSDERADRTRDGVRICEGALVDLEARDAETVGCVANCRPTSVARAHDGHETECYGLEERGFDGCREVRRSLVTDEEKDVVFVHADELVLLERSHACAVV